MDKDKVVTEDNYKQVVLKRMITLCWVLLGICFVVKIFGGNFFAFIGENETIEYLCRVWYFRIPLHFIFYFFGTYLLCLILLNNKHKLLSVFSTIIMFTFKQLALINSIWVVISFIVEFFGLILLPILLKRKWYDVVFINILVVVYQVVAMITKNIAVENFPVNDVVGYIFMIDYYIMLFLTMLYSKKGEISIMQLGVWFLSKDTTQLEAYKGILKDKYEKKVARIDAKIEKINKKK